MPDVLEAWDELGEVESLDPHTPLPDQARASLHDRLIFRIKAALQQAARTAAAWPVAGGTGGVDPFLARTRQDKRLTEWTERLEEFVLKCRQKVHSVSRTQSALA